MNDKQKLYLNYEVKRKQLITSLNTYNAQIRQELLQYSLDLNDIHKDLVYELLIEFYFNCIADFVKWIKQFKK